MTKQLYKAIYFSDHPGDTARERSVTVAFGSEEVELFDLVRPLSSDEARKIIGIDSYGKLTELAAEANVSVNRYCINRLRTLLSSEKSNHRDQLRILPEVIENKLVFDPISVTFKGGKREPFNRWYPLIQGYSPSFVEEIIERYHPEAQSLLDPFSGTGSSVLAASEMGKTGYYCELNPVLQYVTHTKILARRLDRKGKTKLANDLDEIRSNLPAVIDNYIEDKILHLSYSRTFDKSKFFPDSTYKIVLQLRSWIDHLGETNPILSRLACVSVLSALVPASYLKRAGDLRYKTKQELNCGIPDVITLVQENLQQMVLDLRDDSPPLLTDPILICEEASSLSRLPSLNVDIVVTSPPYVNGTNYFRNTKIELWFLKSIAKPDDLRRFRDLAVTAGINDVKLSKKMGEKIRWLEPVIRELEAAAYDKRIPRMIEAYFNDLFRIFGAVRNHLSPDAILAIDIGDSAYAGIHVPSDKFINLLMEDLGFENVEEIPLRSRRSRGGRSLIQSLLVYRSLSSSGTIHRIDNNLSKENTKWKQFKKSLPHQTKPYSKRNWGHPRHSLCSYQGKLKPSIAYHLVDAFVPDGGSILDPFAGVGTIPFEAAIQGKLALGFEISPAAFYIANGKLNNPDIDDCLRIIENLRKYIQKRGLRKKEKQAYTFGLNGVLKDYFHEKTLNEILLARRFFLEINEKDSAETFVMASLLHILHGNRPYALSRRSHPITPYKPTGESIYKSLIDSLRSKVERMVRAELPDKFKPGKMYFQDATSWWPTEIQDLDAVITSPPFFDSTRFYAANWMRLWFSGWEPNDFRSKPLGFIDERQKTSFEVYRPIFRQIRERLKPSGVVILHLGKSNKCDMAAKLTEISEPWFSVVDKFDESVKHIESHGIRDKGGTSIHQYLILH